MTGVVEIVGGLALYWTGPRLREIKDGKEVACYTQMVDCSYMEPYGWTSVACDDRPSGKEFCVPTLPPPEIGPEEE